jgi:predicted neutral ceramidase superfamily lipid hydrolase
MPIPLAAALNAINWALLLREAPKMVREARQLYETIGRRRAATKSSPRINTDDPGEVSEVINELRARIDEMEANNARQVELISQLASQGEALSEALETIAQRMSALVWITIGAIVVAAIALGFAMAN